MSSVTTAPRLDRATMRRNLDGFKHRWHERLDGWRSLDEGALERKYAQSYWAELLACFGITASRMDLFEQDAKRASSGQRGYIDLFWPGVVIGEAKKPGVDLQVAIDQARDYLLGGTVNDAEQPRYIVATDFYRIRLMRLGDPETRFNIEFLLEEITDHVDELKFLAGYEDKLTHVEQTRASIAASKIMANLFTAMVGDEVDEAVGDAAPTYMQDEELAVQETSMFLTRLLFLLFGDDAGLWEQDLFYRFILEHTNSENLGTQLAGLFEVLNTPEERRRRVPDSMAAFPYVNGTLFETIMPTQFFTPEMRDAILVACRFQWTNISPAIFGSLFQLVKSKEARRDDGEHYTSEKNILKTLGPLFLDELREEADRLINSKSTSVKKLREFRDSLATHVFMDPACGSGNFLIVAYRELRKIETDVIVAIREREGNTAMSLDITWEQKLSIGQFYGIELNWWPARIAETAMFLVDHQANRELADRVGLAPERLPISITAHITHANALAVDWRNVLPETTGQTYVFGNPPFIGHQTKSKQQRDELKTVWGKDSNGLLDYVTGWHAQVKTLLAKRQGEFAYVTTNSITQGQAVPALFKPLIRDGWRIKFAHRTFAWDSEAPGKAAVHCVIVGFTRDRSVKQRLWDYPDVKGEAVEQQIEQGINAYLIDGPHLLVERINNPISVELPTAHFGTMPLGKFLLVEVDEYDEVAADPIAAKYLRPFRGSRELVRGLDRWCLWMADEDFDPSDIAQSPVLKERVTACKEFRENSSTGGDAYKYRGTPHLMRPNKDRPVVDYLLIPSVVSETRPYFTAQQVPGDVIASNLAFTVEDPTGFAFSLISSSMFITWQRTVGGRMKSDLRFANTLTWNTFPVPELDDKTRQRIIDAGKKVLAARELHPERSLAEHYNPLAMDPALLKAHAALDKEVDKAFGAPRKRTSEKQRQEILLAAYATLIADQK
ncbi:DNA methyltransferase [Corynebacterium sp. NML130628]|uniref:DNA methyltransferase n=1 Tax=Corynebacterium sp. NML130628 TaxID=1906333 RepID=UPI0008FAF6B4|nr:DNA methyltransferase [Corynebacterium sp. NML130628]OIR46437.1 GcrY protein [Corynebacterium sp. NML130628]